MPELQKGFYITSFEGKTIHSFLTGQCGFSDEYITSKIKTVLINGGPVDDILNTKIRENCVCALSGAMPGIVGAMMRIGSPYASMRESITVKPDNSGVSGKEIIVELKLFNIILSDMGLEFLKHGIMIEKERIHNLINKHYIEISANSRGLSLNGSYINIENLSIENRVNIGELAVLKIEIEDEINS